MTVNDTHAIGRTPLDEQLALRKQYCLTKHHTHNRHTFTLPLGFEPEIGTTEQPLTQAFDGAATEIGKYKTYGCIFIFV